MNFQLPPAPADGPWIRLFDTADDGIAPKSLGSARSYLLQGRSCVLLEC